MVVPAKRSRKLVIRGCNAKAELRNRTSQEIVQAVNTAMGKNDAMIARIMLNDNVIITFQIDAEPKTQNIKWITKAFGTLASLLKRKLAVITKELSAAKLRNIYDKAELATILNRSNNTKIAKYRRYHGYGMQYGVRDDVC
jgi:hypothetical protein